MSGKVILLTWSTTSEQNNDRFEIEYTNETEFQKIGEIKAPEGNSNTRRDYSFQHKNPTGKISYYRLKQMDRDGKFQYSKIAAVRADLSSNTLTVYPNPVKETATLALPQLATGTKVLVMLTDIRGQKMLDRQSTIQGQNMSLDVRNLATGTYLLKVSVIGTKEEFTTKMIKH